MIIDESLFAFNLNVYITQYWKVKRDWVMYHEDNWKYGMQCEENFIQILYCFGLNIAQIQDCIRIIKAIYRHKNYSLFQRDFARIVEYCIKLKEEC